MVESAFDSVVRKLKDADEAIKSAEYFLDEALKEGRLTKKQLEKMSRLHASIQKRLTKCNEHLQKNG